MNIFKLTKSIVAIATITSLTGSVLAQQVTLDKDQIVKQSKPYSPFVEQHFPQRVYWGDTHHHTILSFDGGLMGTSRS